MAKAIIVTYFLVLTIYLVSAYQKECAIGPEYWCKSFQNAQDCGAVEHCTKTVWRDDPQHKQVKSSTKCEWCQKILENTQKAIETIASNEDAIQSTLINACKLLPLEDVSTKCIDTVETSTTTVLSLMKNQRYDTLCQLMDICPKVDEQIDSDDQSKMLCNVLVRATHELHVNQQKKKDEIEKFLKNDCQKLQTVELVQKCEDVLERHGKEIYAHVVSKIELSKICDYLGTSSPEIIRPVHCELCTVVLSNAKQMIYGKHTEDTILHYIDEQICSRLTGKTKRTCQKMIDENGKELIKKIEQGTQPILLCTHFQVCLDEIVERKSPIQKDEMRSFLINDLCEKLGSLKETCKALIEKDTSRLLKILVTDLKGEDLCKLFGLCPKKSLVLDPINLTDDPSQCKRCVKDFTRRKHIAERLVNHSSEFLSHLCGQLPEKDDCMKAVDQSISDLLTFIQSLDPRDICVKLNMCDQKTLKTLEKTTIIPSEKTINEEILKYIKSDVCPKLDSLSSLCAQLVDSEGSNLLDLITKKIDPHEVCKVLDICPSNLLLKNSDDKCQYCAKKIEVYQKQLEKFLKAMVSSTRIMCDYVPNRDVCLALADVFESNVNKVVASFDSKKPCQLLSLCKPSEKKFDEDQCETCKKELDIRKKRFSTTIKELTKTSLPLCDAPHCRVSIELVQEQTLKLIEKDSSTNLCERLGYCLKEITWEPSATLLRLRSLVQHQKKSLEERLEAHDICSEYGQMKKMCKDLLISVDSQRYARVYLALLTKNLKLVDDDLREQMQTKVNVDICDSCKNAVQSSKDFWKKALESVRSVVLSTCTYCSVEKQCRDYYNRRFDDVNSYLDSIDPDEFCQTLHLCSTSSQEDRLDKIWKEIPKSPKDTLKKLEEYLPHTLVELSSTKSDDDVDETPDITVDSNSSCILCEYVMNILSKYIHQQSTEQEIEQGLEKVCNDMPSTLRNQCHELVENYGPSIIATLIGDFDVSTICRKLNLCTKQMKVNLSHITKAHTESCGVCDYVSTYIDFALKRDSSEKSLQRALSTVCTHLSGEQTSKCQTLVQLMASDIRKLKLGSGDNFCKQLSICQTPMSELKPAIYLDRQSALQQDEKLKEIIVKNLDDAPQCTLCRYVVTYLDAFLKNNKSEEALKEALSRVCTILPRKRRVECNEFVRTYAPVLAELVAEMASPELVCRDLGLCQVILPQDTKPVTYSNHQYARIPV